MTPERLDEIRGWMEAGASGPEWMHATEDLFAEVDRLQACKDVPRLMLRAESAEREAVHLRAERDAAIAGNERLIREVDRLQSLVAASMDSGHVKIVERERDEARAALRGCEQALLDGLNKLVWDDPDNWREWRTFTARPSILEAKKALGDL